MMTEPTKSLTAQALTKAVILALMLIPTGISVFAAFEIKNMSSVTVAAVYGEPQIVCFDPDVCAIEVHGKWYRIAGIIELDKTVPEEYRLEDLVADAELARQIEPDAEPETDPKSDQKED